jgi:hypothetical protein
MRANLSDAQYSTLIGIVARLPIEAARRTFLERIEAALPSTGKISEAQLTDAVNATLKGFEPGAYHLDHLGVWRASGDFGPEPTTLTEAAASYQRTLQENKSGERKVYWPPIAKAPELTEEQRKAIKDKVEAMTWEQVVEAYARPMFATEEEYQRVQAEVAERKARELEEVARWPIDPSPPTTQVIWGEVVPEPAPTDDELLRRAVVEQPDEEDKRLSPMAEASRLAKRKGKRRCTGLNGKPPKVFW